MASEETVVRKASAGVDVGAGIGISVGPGVPPDVADHAACAAVVRSRDTRFDGVFFTAVRTTGIYCRPSCPAMTPKAAHMTFYRTAAAAQGAGYRACKRCRPDATPGSPEWHQRGDVVARAVRLVDDGVIEREGVPGLAARLGYSTRQLQRLTVAELGAAPLALARARRAQTARILVETTGMPMADIAFAAGFSSIRSFNETMRAVFDTSPGELRGRAARRAAQPALPEADGAPISIELRLPVRGPLHVPSPWGHLVSTAVPGVETWSPLDNALHVALRLPHGSGTASLVADLRARATTSVPVTLRLTDLRDLTAAIGRCRALLDLDADPVAVDAHLAADPALAPLVRSILGVRLPGTTDPHGLALRVVLGQQVSTVAAARLGARLTATLGEPLPPALRSHSLTHLFPTAQALAEAGEDAVPGMPRTRRRALLALAGALAEGSLVLDPGADRARARADLLALPGIGPWTTEMILLRGLGDPDAWPGSDLGVRSSAQAAGLPLAERALATRSAGWRPWRGYAAALLWASSAHEANGTHLRLGGDGGEDHPSGAPAPTGQYGIPEETA